MLLFIGVVMVILDKDGSWLEGLLQVSLVKTFEKFFLLTRQSQWRVLDCAIQFVTDAEAFMSVCSHAFRQIVIYETTSDVEWQ